MPFFFDDYEGQSIRETSTRKGNGIPYLSTERFVSSFFGAGYLVNLSSGPGQVPLIQNHAQPQQFPGLV